MKYHRFGVEVAATISLNAAIIFDFVAYWTIRHQQQWECIKDGRPWVYTTAAGLTYLYPYLSAGQIRTAFRKLQEAGLIESGGPVVTEWGKGTAYTLTEKGKDIYC